MDTTREQLITSEGYGRAVDALIYALPDDPYAPCPCGCGIKCKFVCNEFAEHEERFIKKHMEIENGTVIRVQ